MKSQLLKIKVAEAATWMRNAAQYVAEQPKSVTVDGVVKKVNRNCGSWFNKATAQAAQILAGNSDCLLPVARADFKYFLFNFFVCSGIARNLLWDRQRK